MNARRFTEAQALADLDPLTGLHNRRYFHETLAREVAPRPPLRPPARRCSSSTLDDFKAINDRIGHLAGDAVLAELARQLRVGRCAPPTSPCRVGGDEFGVILPESDGADAELLAARIAQRSRAAGRQSRTLDISAGVAECAGDDAVELFERADAALYRAKELGKARPSLPDGRGRTRERGDAFDGPRTHSGRPSGTGRVSDSGQSERSDGPAGDGPFSCARPGRTRCRRSPLSRRAAIDLGVSLGLAGFVRLDRCPTRGSPPKSTSRPPKSIELAVLADLLERLEQRLPLVAPRGRSARSGVMLDRAGTA